LEGVRVSFRELGLVPRGAGTPVRRSRVEGVGLFKKLRTHFLK
jgi:hypothetical protein